MEYHLELLTIVVVYVVETPLLAITFVLIKIVILVLVPTGALGAHLQNNAWQLAKRLLFNVELMAKLLNGYKDLARAINSV
jgi:hypothetical protein